MNTENATFPENNWEPPKVSREIHSDGSQYVVSQHPLRPVHENLVAMFKHTVTRYPQRSFMAQRHPHSGEWQHLSYQDADNKSDNIAQWLLNQDLGQQSPVLILSGNSLEHATLIQAGYKAGVPLAPVSPNYSLLSKDFKKLKAIVKTVNPGAVFVQDASMYQRALDALDLRRIPVIYVTADNPDAVSGNAVSFDTLLRTPATEAVTHAIRRLTSHHVAKILFTSGSTGAPKGVMNTHGNLAYTQSALNSLIHVDPDTNPPTLLDWMPWHHTYAGNQNIHRVIYNGGTMYIDEGKPLPGQFETTLKNIADVAVDSYTTVPAVYALLLDALEKHDALRQRFFSKLEWCSYGGSDMPQSTYDRFQKLAIAETGHRIPMINALGSTESAAVITLVHWTTNSMGSVGLPLPGTELKLVPVGDKFEMRVRGPQIMTGYINNEAKTQEVFDDQGYFCTGDAVKWVDDDNPEKGLRFAGRVSEDFKLLNGTWVHTGALRSLLLSALTPLVADIVITGQDKDYLGILAWPNPEGIKAVVPGEDDLVSLLKSDALTQKVKQALLQHNTAHSGASMRIRRFSWLTTPPDADAGEVSDKRSINQSAVLSLRKNNVEQLYQEPLCPGVIAIPKAASSDSES